MMELYPRLTIFAINSHSGPLLDIKTILSRFNIVVNDKMLPGRSAAPVGNSGDEKLKVVHNDNWKDLQPCPNRFRDEFYSAYLNDSEMQSIDAFLCTHDSSFCEMYMAFGKPIIVVATTRYEIGRHDAERWAEWNENLRLIASKPYNFVGANNMYDVEYIKYFTGIGQIHYLPSLCSHAAGDSIEKSSTWPFHGQNDTDQVSYHPTFFNILVVPPRRSKAVGHLIAELIELAAPRGLLISAVRQLYEHYEYADLANHPAVVLIPLQLSFMLLFEVYQLGIPIFAPTPGLLLQWHKEHDLLVERSWMGLYTSRKSDRRSPIRRHPNSSSVYTSDPNDDTEESPSLSEWILSADFYRLPHITLYSSFEDLVDKLITTNLRDISAKMTEFNRQQERRVYRQWKNVIRRIMLHPRLKAKQRRCLLNHGSSGNQGTVASSTQSTTLCAINNEGENTCNVYDVYSNSSDVCLLTSNETPFIADGDCMISAVGEVVKRGGATFSDEEGMRVEVMSIGDDVNEHSAKYNHNIGTPAADDIAIVASVDSDINTVPIDTDIDDFITKDDLSFADALLYYYGYDLNTSHYC